MFTQRTIAINKLGSAMDKLLVSQQEGRPGLYDQELSTLQAMQILRSLGQHGQQMRLVAMATS